MRRRKQKLPDEVTFRVGAPPPAPRRPSPPVSVWPAAVLGMLLVMTVVLISLGHHAGTANAPASTSTSISATP